MSSSTPHCKRTGICCNTIPLTQSPKELRRLYDLSIEENSDYEIRYIYPMLKGTCRGKVYNFHQAVEGQPTYIYGPCKNLKYEAVGNELKAACGIHENKPPMCSGYPNYENWPADEWNHGTFKGCGYNDTTHGRDWNWPSEVLPLESDEQEYVD